MQPQSVHLEVERLEDRSLLSVAPLASPWLPPVAYLQATNATITTPGVYQVAVVYRDPQPLLPWSLRTGNVHITGPAGFSETPALWWLRHSGIFTTVFYAVQPPRGGWSFRNDGIYRVTLGAHQVYDRTHALPASVVGSFRVAIPPPDWFDTHLNDSGIRNLVRADEKDRSLSRTDMLGIFNQAEKEGVTKNVLHDLQTVVASATQLDMPAYVQNLAAKVVDGDPANAHYQNRPLGNLHLGSSRQQLQLLVDKWFLGEDHPTTFPGLHYEYAAGSLVGSGASYQDVIQGSSNDCYLLAGLASLAEQSPATIRNLFIDNGDGTFTVRFQHEGRSDYVTVDRELPATDEGTYAYANMGQSLTDPRVKLWVALAEKAYAQLAESGWSRLSPRPNAYASIDDGWEGNVVEQVTGRNTAFRPSAPTLAGFQTLVGAFQTGKLIGLDTGDQTSFDLVPNHVYVVVGMNAAKRLFEVYNPWGFTQELAWSQLAGNLLGYSVTVS